LKKGVYIKDSDLSPLDKDFLIERHLMSPNFMHDDNARALYLSNDEHISIMINEEDHIRMQALVPGLNPEKAFDRIGEYDSEIGKYLEFDYDADFGFLTSCPTNVGTGLRTSILIHLPGLVITKEIDRVIAKITKMGVAVRGFYGEGTDVLGNLFQVSNQKTLGISEKETLESLTNVCRYIIDEEAQSRQLLMDEAFEQIRDKIWRSYGILKYAHVLTSEEVMNLLSALRLGIALNIIDFIGIPLINEVLLFSQPAHLQKYYSEEMDQDRRDYIRAQMVREKFSTFDK
jgi:protein arginine kinase